MKSYLGCIALLFISCGEIEIDTEPTDHSVALNQVYKTFSQAYAEKDIGLIEAIYTTDAIYLTPGDTIKQSADDFIPGFADMFHRAEVDSTNLKLEFQIKNRQQFPNLAVDAGYYRFTRTEAGKDLHTSVGKFITILRRHADGTWKFTHDGYSDAPLTAWSKQHITISAFD